MTEGAVPAIGWKYNRVVDNLRILQCAPIEHRAQPPVLCSGHSGEIRTPFQEGEGGFVDHLARSGHGDAIEQPKDRIIDSREPHKAVSISPNRWSSSLVLVQR
jgi:hypothetical protein